MSEILGSYAFVSSLRRGISTEIAYKDGDPNPPVRAAAPVTVNLNGGALHATANLELYGPGEITGVEALGVTRTWPRTNVFDAESNLFPLIEFDQSDLPWRFTPASPSAADRLRPWLCLVVLEDSEIAKKNAAGPKGELPSIVVKSAHDSLPNLSQSWAWAHAQVSGQKTVSASETASILQTAPHRVLSRIICPRRMKERTAYTGYLVPTFERGRLAGLRQPVPDTVKGVDPAWTDGSTMVELPVFYQWNFQTAPQGDFEFLVRLLRARPLPPTVGIRDMDVGNPGAGLPAAAPHALGLEGALKSPATKTTAWEEPARGTFITRLRVLLNAPAEFLASALHRLVVAPPLYGRWHAAQTTLNPGEKPVWFQDLNSDLRHRTEAGLGTQVVQANQRPLMAAAWDQVEGIIQANEERRRLKLAREASIRLLDEFVAAPEPERLLAVTAPLHARIMGSPTTIRTQIQESPITDAVLEPQFRRVSRPLGPLGRRQGRPSMARAGSLLERLNRGELSPAPPPKTPEPLPTPGKLGAGLVPGWATPEGLEARRRLSATLRALAIILLVLAIALLFFGVTGIVLAVVAAVGAAASIVAARSMQSQVESAEKRIAVRDDAITPVAVRDAPLPAGFLPVVTPAGAAVPTAPAVAPSPGGSPAGGPTADPPHAAAFRTAMIALLTEVHEPPAPGRELIRLDLPRVQSKIMASLDPRKTFAAAIAGRYQVGPGVIWEPEDPIDEILIAPEFKSPMYEPLADLSQDWLLPGLDQIPPNTATLAVTNQKFVESYMVGLNHEMGRELRWNEYPYTDQRGSYFRQFWAVEGVVPAPGETEESLKDIKPIHAWRKANELGQNSARKPLPGGKEHLVLLIRGDLIKRYPNVEVYAVKTILDGAKKRQLDPDHAHEKHPIFRGKLKPDVRFYGFELTTDEAKGSPDVTTDQGWYFVLQEHPEEPRFGLDVPQTEGAHPAFGGTPLDRDSFTWGDLAADEPGFHAINYIDLNAARPDISGMGARNGAAWHADAGLGPHGSRSAHIAYLTLQKPVRIAIHGSDMIPTGA